MIIQKSLPAEEARYKRRLYQDKEEKERKELQNNSMPERSD